MIRWWQIIWKKNNGFIDKQLFHSFKQHLSKSTENAKTNIFLEFLKNSITTICTKCYWSLIKTGKNGKKVPCVPPIYNNIFNSYFSEQYTLLQNISTLPNICSKHTNNILDTIIFSKEDIYIYIYIIKNLDPKKAHGYCYCTTEIWVNMLYLMDHLMNFSITLNNP